MNLREQALLFVEQGPTFQGALGRLILPWDPTIVEMWMRREIEIGTPPHDIAKALAEVMAAATWGAVMAAPPGVDKLGFLNDDLGILAQMRERLELRLRGRPPDIIIPGAGG